MTALKHIPIHVESEISTGNVVPLLHEIKHALDKLLEHGEETLVDLTTLPMSAGDLDDLLDRLGAGEVDIRLAALGESRIRETTYPGVWLVEHFQAGGDLLTRHLEVCLIPAIVRAQPEDIRDGLRRLSELSAAAA